MGRSKREERNESGTVCETVKKSRFQRSSLKTKLQIWSICSRGEVWAIDCFNKSTLKSILRVPSQVHRRERGTLHAFWPLFASPYI